MGERGLGAGVVVHASAPSTVRGSGARGSLNRMSGTVRGRCTDVELGQGFCSS